MRPVIKTQVGVGVTDPIPFKVNTDSFSVGLGVTVSGTVNYTVQHTFDDINTVGVDINSLNWFNSSVLNEVTTSGDANYAYPVQAIRLVVNSGSGTAKLIAIQSGVGV